MKEGPSAVRRIHIDRLELDVRGIAPAAAEGAARALGPALTRALAGGNVGVTRDGRAAHTERADAGRLVAPSASPEAGDLAALVAARIATIIGEGRR
jgi:hypothetical protein